MATTKDADQVAADYEAIKRDLGSLRDEFGALLGHLRSGASHAADSVSRTARHQVEERPVTVLLGAFLAGFLTSLIFGRLHR
jgi:hypothetical protein